MQGVSPEARELTKRAFVIDLHTDSLVTAHVLGRDLSKRHTAPDGFMPWRLHADIPKLKEGGIDAVCLGIVTHPLPLGARRRALENLRYGRHVVRRNEDSMTLAGSPDDIDRAREEGKIAVLFGVEGMHMLSGDLGAITEFYELGARYVTLAHFTSNRFAVSSADPFARRVKVNERLAATLELMNSLGMIVDVAHVHPDLIQQVCARSEVPVIVSHGATQALRPTFRNLSDEDIVRVASTDGVIGVIYATEWLGRRADGVSIGAIVDHADHIRKLVGPDHVALGSDWDGFISTPSELPDAAALPALTQAFLDRSWPTEDIEKLLGGNFMRVFRRVHSARAD